MNSDQKGTTSAEFYKLHEDIQKGRIERLSSNVNAIRDFIYDDARFGNPMFLFSQALCSSCDLVTEDMVRYRKRFDGRASYIPSEEDMRVLAEIVERRILRLITLFQEYRELVDLLLSAPPLVVKGI